MVAPVCEQNVTGRVVYFPERMKQLVFKDGIIEEGNIFEKGFSYAPMEKPELKIFPISAKTGEGVDTWCEWLSQEVNLWKSK